MTDWIEVESSWIAAINYFEPESILEIGLQNGKTYVYFDVPKEVYDEMLLAESKGKFYNWRVKGLYNSLLLEPRGLPPE
jgi:hypothetical protein